MVQESQNTDSLYDYFYLDQARICSLISQITSGGIQISFKETKSISDKSSQQCSAKIPFLTSTLSGEDGISKSNERLYDSSFGHPLELLSILQEKGRLNSDLKKTNLGDLVIINGIMSVFDTKMIADSFPLLKKMINNTNNGSQAKKEREHINNAAEIMKIIPTSPQIDFTDTEKNSVWMSVNSDNLKINTSDIVLKYGAKIPGTWYVVGIIDAKPDSNIDDNDDLSLNNNYLKSSFSNLFEAIRNMFGRPQNAYGITPIIIFRAIY